MNRLSRVLFLAAALGLSLPAVAGPTVADPSPYVTTQITVTGAVKTPLTLDVAALRGFPAELLEEVPLVCQSGANLGKLENFRGVRLRDILDRAVIDAPGHNDVKKMVVIASASDDYRVVFSWSELFNTPVGDSVLVLFEKDGLPLPDSDGRIALVSAKDLRTGPRRVKWLQGIEVRKIVD